MGFPYSLGKVPYHLNLWYLPVENNLLYYCPDLRTLSFLPVVPSKDSGKIPQVVPGLAIQEFLFSPRKKYLWYHHDFLVVPCSWYHRNFMAGWRESWLLEFLRKRHGNPRDGHLLAPEEFGYTRGTKHTKNFRV